MDVTRCAHPSQTWQIVRYIYGTSSRGAGHDGLGAGVGAHCCGAIAMAVLNEAGFKLDHWLQLSVFSAFGGPCQWQPSLATLRHGQLRVSRRSGVMTVVVPVCEHVV